jgi:hypothetical protein
MRELCSVVVVVLEVRRVQLRKDPCEENQRRIGTTIFVRMKDILGFKVQFPTGRTELLTSHSTLIPAGTMTSDASQLESHKNISKNSILKGPSGIL